MMWCLGYVGSVQKAFLAGCSALAQNKHQESHNSAMKVLFSELLRDLKLIRELKNHDEIHDDDVCWPGKDRNENVSFGGKKET